MNQYTNPPPHGYGYQYPPMHQLPLYRKPIRRYSHVIFIGLLLMQVVSLASVLLLDWAFSFSTLHTLSMEQQDLISTSIDLTAYILCFWLPTLFMLSWIKIPPSAAFPMRRPQASIAIPAVFVALSASVVGSLLSSSLSAVIQTLFGVMPIMPDMSAPLGLPANIVYAVGMTVGPAVFEELMFRGVILQSLRRFGDGFALVTSSILFALCHGNLVQGPNAMLMGLVIGYFVLRTGSMVTGMVIHLVNNGMVIALNYGFAALSLEAAGTLNLAVLAFYLLSGTVALGYLWHTQGNSLFRVAPSRYPMPTHKKYTAFFTTISAIVYILYIVWLTSQYFQ